MKRGVLRFGLCCGVLFAATVLLGDDKNSSSKPGPWAKAMARFEKLDAEQSPKPGGIVFVGSSSIRLWDLDKSFPDWNALNRGFGGSQLADSVRNIDLLVLKHRPRAVVVYAGDNDIWAGKTPAEVADDFRAFESAIHKNLPETKILYIAIKPSLARWSKAGVMGKANDLIAAICKKSSHCQYINIWDKMLGTDGRPRKELLRSDGLHLSPAGYAIWTNAIRAAIDDINQANDE